MYSSGLSVVGWYHSHPSNDALPSVSDISQQLMYQESLENNDTITNPCIGFIIGSSYKCYCCHVYCHVYSYCLLLLFTVIVYCYCVLSSDLGQIQHKSI